MADRYEDLSRLKDLPLVTPRLILRYFNLEDVPLIFSMSQEIGIRKWLPDQVYGSRKKAQEVVEYLIEQYNSNHGPKNSPFVLGIFLKGSGKLIGHVGLSPIKEGVEIGFAIMEKYQNQNLASEAVSVFSDWGLNIFGLNEIWGIAAAENISSCRVLENSGFALVNEKSRELHGDFQPVKTYRKMNNSPTI